MSWRVEALLAGTPTPFRDGEASAIAKQPIAGKVAITKLGLEGDTQADRVHHGGPDMALHIYPLDHHHWWRGEIGEHPLLAQPGAFGSNIAVSGLDELSVAIGARFRLGTALVEVTRPRQPCWKIEHRFGARGMVRRIVQTARCGWLMRVLEEGEAEAGDMLEQVEAGDQHWHVARTFAAIWGQRRPDRDAHLREIAALPALAEGLRADLLRGD
jgi:MOSC domain-containing protein YiiM